MTAPPLLQVRDLHVRYGTAHVLHGVDLDLGMGEVLAMLGRNGMGKTTTIRAIMGLTPPCKGSVVFKGREITGRPAFEIARSGIGLAPEGRGIFPSLSARENLIMAARPGPEGRNDWKLETVLELFPRLGQRLHHPGDRLSGGEQQMLAIARALMTNPDLLILDEATEGLAPLVRAEIWNTIARIGASGISVLLVDKDLDSLLTLCHRCLILEKGRKVYEGGSSHLAANPEIHLRHLGV